MGPKKKELRRKEGIGFLTAASVPQEGSAGLTGTWRTFRPVLDKERCTGCLLCWIFCPEACMTKELEIDYRFCKGCGICAEECPRKAITMVEEEKP